MRKGTANRFNVKIPITENPNGKETEALHVKELAGKDYETEVVGSELPVVVHFYATDSKACEALAPRYAAVAEKFAGKVRFLKVLRTGSAELASRLGVTASPTLIFVSGGKEKEDRLSGEDIQRTALKARVEAMLGVAPAVNPAVVHP
jgi:thiol-disulfide isomerase/thioredoxin